MLHQCSSHRGGGAVASPCSCGFIHGACSGGGAAFSILFPMAAAAAAGSQHHLMVDCNVSGGNISPSSSVDCTLSLGTPSTRHSDKVKCSSSTSKAIHHTSCVPSFCWDILSKSTSSRSSSHNNNTTTSSARGTNSANNTCSSNLGADPLLLARRCANCDTTSTPLWRNGPRGPKSLCNACGIRYKKEERRAAASTVVAEPVTTGYNYQRQTVQQPWGSYTTSSTINGTSKETPISMSFATDANGSLDDDDNDVPYLSWRLNVMPTAAAAQFPVRDRPSLFQY